MKYLAHDTLKLQTVLISLGFVIHILLFFLTFWGEPSHQCVVAKSYMTFAHHTLTTLTSPFMQYWNWHIIKQFGRDNALYKISCVNYWVFLLNRCRVHRVSSFHINIHACRLDRASNFLNDTTTFLIGRMFVTCWSRYWTSHFTGAQALYLRW